MATTPRRVGAPSPAPTPGAPSPQASAQLGPADATGAPRCAATTRKGARCGFPPVAEGLCLLHGTMRQAAREELL